MANVPGLRSPYDKVGRLIHFGRMLDKVRLHAAGKLPADYMKNLGESHPGFADGRVCRFLGIPYAEVVKRTLHGGTDEEIYAWAESRGKPRTDEECYIFNTFMAKRGWRDERTDGRNKHVAESGLTGKPIETMFDFIDYDEGRDPAKHRGWIAS
jgi:hypothetical protein